MPSNKDNILTLLLYRNLPFKLLQIVCCSYIFIFGLAGITSADAETFHVTATGRSTKTGVDLDHAMSPNEVSDPQRNINTDAVDGLIGPNDEILLYDVDGDFKVPITVGRSQTAGKVLTIKAAPGNYPVFDGSQSVLASPWVQETGINANTYSMIFKDNRFAPVSGLWYTKNGSSVISWGVLKANASSLFTQGDWYYDASTYKLYIYSDAMIPASYYSKLAVNLDPRYSIINRAWNKTPGYTNVYDVYITMNGNGISRLWYNGNNVGRLKSSAAAVDTGADGDWYIDTSNSHLFVRNHSGSPSANFSSLQMDTVPYGIWSYNNKAGGVAIDGISFRYFSKGIAVQSDMTDYLRVTNCTFQYYFRGISAYPFSASGKQYIGQTGASNNFTQGYGADSAQSYAISGGSGPAEIINNNIDNNTYVSGSLVQIGSGILFCDWTTGFSVAGTKIQHNALKNIGNTGISLFNQWNTGSGGRDVNMDISYNVITASGSRVAGDYDGIGIGGWATSIDSAWKNIMIHHNYIRGFENTGIHLTNCNGADSVVYDNIIDGSGLTGVTGYAAIKLSGGASAYNNTIYNIRNWAGIWITKDVGAAPSVVKNNIIHTITYDDPLGVSCDSGDTTSVLGHNLFYNILGGNSKNYSKNCPTHSHDVTSDPLFINGSGNYSSASDFRLKSTSPAIDAGISVGITVDYDGNAVPFGSAPDIGAFEFGAKAPLQVQRLRKKK